MGVAGLWEVLRPAGQVRSLTELAVEDGFNVNSSNQRGFRIGIDASIWFFHAAYGREGENPELRTLFFRCCRLLQSPLLPLFVFDGPNRPAIKRGKRVGGNVHWLTQGMKNIIDAFGFEWRVAPGEAEAELAYLNRIGIIDAVLSDDVDNFLFGATMVIRNPSSTLSGNRAHPVMNAQGKDDGNHVVTYTVGAILSNPSVAMSRPGAILIGLLSGGDYVPAGLPGCGQKFATGLARAGFGDSLVKAIGGLKGPQLDAFLDQWRQDIKNELRSNKSGLLPSKKPSLATSLPDDFPSLPVLMSYMDPLTSENTPQKSSRKAPPPVWRNDPDPMRIASLCELYFEWGVKDVIVHRFRTVLWPGIVCRAVRRAVLNKDECRCLPLAIARHPGHKDDNVTGPSSPTKRLTSNFSSLALSSPPKKSSPSEQSTPECFALSSLVPLTLPASASSSRSSSPSSSTSHTSGGSPLLLEILSQRTHASTDSMLEYRVLVDPTVLVERAESGVKGLRPPLVGGLFGIDSEDENEDGGALDQDADESGGDDVTGSVERLETAAGAAARSGIKKRKARREVPTMPLRLWLPACMIRAAAPALVKAYGEKVKMREEKKAKRGPKGVRGRRVGTGVRPTATMPAKRDMGDNNDGSIPGPSTSKIAESKAKSKVARTGGGRRRKPKHTSEAQDEAYEFIDLSAGESPCCSDDEDVKGDTKRKGKARANVGKLATVNSTAKANMTNKQTTITSTVNEYFKTTKSSTMTATKSNLCSAWPLAARAPASNPAALGRVYEKEEESVDTVVLPPLPGSARPLDILRARHGSGPVGPVPTSKFKSKFVPRYEEESSSSSQSALVSVCRPNISSLPSRTSQSSTQRRKKPLSVDISDTDSDIEVSDARRPLSCTTAAVMTREDVQSRPDPRGANMSASIGVGKTLSTFASEKNVGKAASNVASLTTKGNASTSTGVSSTSIPIVSLPPAHPSSGSLGAGTIDPTPSAQSPSKLAHILLHLSVSESEGEGSQECELPMLHHGFAGSKVKRRATITRLALQPFPMRLGSASPPSSHASRLGQRDVNHEDDDGSVEIVDVFTTSHGASLPRSPTPSPSPDGPPSTHTPAGLSTLVVSKQSDRFPASPTKPMSNTDADLHERTKQGRRASSGRSTPVSGNEKEGMLKSPRKSEAHSSPRHVGPARRHTSSPTPLALSNRESTQMSEIVGQKPRPSDASASVIYISSGSEDEDSAGVGVYLSKAGFSDGRDGCTDGYADTRADTAMILSVPPSPAPERGDLAPSIPAVEVALPGPARGSKFKPAPAAIHKLGVRAPPVESTRITPMSAKNREDSVEPRPVRGAPSLAARSRNEVVDLTSD